MSDISPELQAKLDRAVRLQRRIDFRKNGTRLLEKRLAALREEIAIAIPKSGSEGTQTAGGGISYNLAAACGNVRVTQPAAKLLGSIPERLASEIRKLIGRASFARLFLTHYSCQKNFRVLALNQLEQDKAKQLIAMVEEPSKTAVVITA